MEDMVRDLLPFLIPLAVIQGGLLLAALIHIIRSKSFRVGNRIVWVLVSFIAIIGPVLYFVLGRSETEGDD